MWFVDTEVFTASGTMFVFCYRLSILWQSGTVHVVFIGYQCDIF